MRCSIKEGGGARLGFFACAMLALLFAGCGRGDDKPTDVEVFFTSQTSVAPTCACSTSICGAALPLKPSVAPPEPPLCSVSSTTRWSAFVVSMG